MLVLLPPSETKITGGDGPPLDLGLLAWPQLSQIRSRLARVLPAVSARPRAGAKALSLGPRQLGELASNVHLLDSPTTPAIERYTGVLYDALDIRSLGAAQRRRADGRLVVCSALFGLVRSGDHIPAYRLSASSKLPRIPSLPALWKPVLTRVLTAALEEDLVVDLRSGAYQALAPAAGAVTVRVLSEHPDGSRSIVSHFNKANKGSIARTLATCVTPPASRDDVMSLLVDAGWSAELGGGGNSGHGIDVITSHAPATARA